MNSPVLARPVLILGPPGPSPSDASTLLTRLAELAVASQRSPVVVDPRLAPWITDATREVQIETWVRTVGRSLGGELWLLYGDDEPQPPAWSIPLVRVWRDYTSPARGGPPSRVRCGPWASWAQSVAAHQLASVR